MLSTPGVQDTERRNFEGLMHNGMSRLRSTLSVFFTTFQIVSIGAIGDLLGSTAENDRLSVGLKYSALSAKADVRFAT